MSKFANKFMYLLRKRRLNQVDAARQLGVTQATVSRWLSGTHQPSFAALMRIAAKLDVPVENFRKARLARKMVVREARAPYGASVPPIEPLEVLKRRWKHADRVQRKAIRAALAHLFPGHHAVLLAWLNAP